ncbi:TRAP transporter small permease subunit [Halioglobus maricola]|uniref:TRAP transporter small permease protein n=1 Tax=Halioglobus maricola TaxID=2601894 RepID=A0A5P9NR26_9GAMM|nr:TRAP transporter small permease subunit [Halioglobus maricola]
MLPALLIVCVVAHKAALCCGCYDTLRQNNQKPPGRVLFISSLKSVVSTIDRVTDVTGRLLAWLALAMGLTTAVIVVMRYGFNTNSIFAQELVTYMHGSLFMLGAAYALKVGAHVRVDIFYREFSARGKAWVDTLGGIVFLIPFCLFVTMVSWQFVSESWAIGEISSEPGGIPAVYLLKGLIPAMALNLLLQGIAETLRSTLTLVED